MQGLIEASLSAAPTVRAKTSTGTDLNEIFESKTSMHFSLSGKFECSMTLRLFGSSDEIIKWLLVCSFCSSGICLPLWRCWLIALINYVIHVPLARTTSEHTDSY